MAILRAERCANCGRDVRGLDDARKEGRRWYCSQSCFLQASSTARSGGRRRREGGPVRRVARVVKWTLLVLGLLMVALIIAAFAGLGDTSNKTSAQTPRARAAKTKPVRLGRVAAVGAGWRLRILPPVAWDAGASIAAVPDQYGSRTQPAHAQDVMLTVAATFAGGGQSFASGDFAGRVFVMGKHRAQYPLTSGLNGCGPGSAKLPAPDAQTAFEQDSRVYSGTTLSGHICFQVATNDVRSLRLGVSPVETLNGKRGRTVWFALR